MTTYRHISKSFGDTIVFDFDAMSWYAEALDNSRKVLKIVDNHVYLETIDGFSVPMFYTIYAQNKDQQANLLKEQKAVDALYKQYVASKFEDVCLEE